MGFVRKNKAVEERSNRTEAGKVIDGGLIRSENPDMSNDKHGKNPCRRKDKVSWARFVRSGLVGC